MSAVAFTAWGSVNIEEMERLQRRKYINLLREEIKEYGLVLHAGGSKGRPLYTLYKGEEKAENRVACGSAKDVCLIAQEIVDGRRTI